MVNILYKGKLKILSKANIPFFMMKKLGMPKAASYCSNVILEEEALPLENSKENPVYSKKVMTKMLSGGKSYYGKLVEYKKVIFGKICIYYNDSDFKFNVADTHVISCFSQVVEDIFIQQLSSEREYKELLASPLILSGEHLSGLKILFEEFSIKFKEKKLSQKDLEELSNSEIRTLVGRQEGGDIISLSYQSELIAQVNT